MSGYQQTDTSISKLCIEYYCNTGSISFLLTLFLFLEHHKMPVNIR